VRKLRERSVEAPPHPDDLDGDVDGDAATLGPGGWRSPDAIDRLIATHGAETICRVLTPMLSDDRIARIDAVLATRLGTVVPVVEDVYDPNNGAAVIRTAEGLGLQELHVLETGLRFQATGGITRGCHRWMDLYRWREPRACIDALRARGFTVLATTPAGAMPIEAVDVARPVAVIFGNEHAGLPQTTIAACDGAVALPMLGFTQSYNLSVSAALVTSQLAARRRALLGADGDLDEGRRAMLRARWFALKIRGVVGVVERAVS